MEFDVEYNPTCECIPISVEDFPNKFSLQGFCHFRKNSNFASETTISEITISKQKSLIMKFYDRDYNTFSGLMLERYFHRKAIESEKFTRIGRW